MVSGAHHSFRHDGVSRTKKGRVHLLSWSLVFAAASFLVEWQIVPPGGTAFAKKNLYRTGYVPYPARSPPISAVE
jgi:hypothetical protein